MYQVILERDNCTMCGHCVEIDESKFNFDDDDKAMIIGAEREDNVDEITVEDVEVYEEAEENCTGQCIEVFEEE
jgi:ferredoxin